MLAFGLVAGAGASAPLGNPAPAAEVRTALPEARLGGATRFTVWGFEVYDAILWTTPGFQPAQWAERPFALELRYLRSFDGDAIAERSLEEMRRAASMTDAQRSQWLAAMKAAFPNVKKGDRLTGVYAPGGGARFFHNGAASGTVSDAQFAQRFFAIWLGPRSSEPAMRDALLGPTGP